MHKSSKLGRADFELCEQTDERTNRQTRILTTIPCTRVGRNSDKERRAIHLRLLVDVLSSSSSLHGGPTHKLGSDELS